MRTLVIGIDGMDYHRCKEWGIDFGIGEIKLIKTIEPSWSPKCWATIFSGLDPAEHGIERFLMDDGEIRKPEDIPNNIFVWNKLSSEGKKCFAVNIPISIPLYCYNCDFKSKYFGLEIKISEIMETHEALDKFAMNLAQQEWDFMAIVYLGIDRMQHITDDEKTLKSYYKRTEASAKELIQYAEDIIVLSDHGAGDVMAYEKRKEKKLYGFGFEEHHGPDGIFCSTIDHDPKTIKDALECLEWR